MAKIDKRKVFSYLNILGIGFVIALVVGYFNFQRSTAPLAENSVEVPRLFDRQFTNVDTKRRLEPLPLLSFMNPEDEMVNWQAFGGDYLLVNFWATWCAPCVLELPSLEKLAKRHEDQGLEVIAVSLDTMRSHEDIKTFLLNRGIGKFAAHYDRDQEIKANIRLRGIPTSFLLDPRGNLLYIFEGDADWDSPPARSFFKAILNPEQ